VVSQKGIINIFAAVNHIRKISPAISLLLATLILAGSSGYSYIIHTCHHCMVEEVMHSLEAVSGEICCDISADCCCVTHEEATEEGCFIRHDCCSHEVEKLLKEDLIRTEVQTELMHFNLLLPLVSVLQYEVLKTGVIIPQQCFLKAGRQITTLNCQIRA